MLKYYLCDVTVKDNKLTLRIERCEQIDCNTFVTTTEIWCTSDNG